MLSRDIEAYDEYCERTAPSDDYASPREAKAVDACMEAARLLVARYGNSQRALAALDERVARSRSHLGADRLHRLASTVISSTKRIA